MHYHKLDANGIGHYLVIGGLVGVFAIGGVGTSVYKASHRHDKSLLSSDSITGSSKKKSHTSTDSQDKFEAAQAKNEPSIPVTPAPTPPQTQSKPPTRSESPTGGQQVQPPAKAPASSPPVAAAPTATPLSVLTEVISNFETKGAPLNVTRDTVTVSGPIRDATAKPIVFGFHDKLYFAYTQTYKPNFSTSPSATANSMAIIPANVSSIAQEAAHLDKANNLVDPNSALVGFSTGGN